MPRLPRRWLTAGCLLLLVGLSAWGASATEIRLIDGQTYSGATVIRRDATSIELQVKYGRTTLPLSMIDTIDGRKALPAPPVALPTGTPRANTAPLASPAAATPRPQERVSPPPRTAVAPRTPVPTAEPTLQKAPRGDRWWWLIAAVAFVAVWGFTVILVRRDLRDGKPAARWGWMVAVVLPIVGYFVYRALSRGLPKLEGWTQAASRSNFEFLDADHQPIPIHIGEEITGIENAKEILQAALHQRASDVHIEPLAQECRVRYRIDGTLYPRARLTPDAGLRLISALKSLAQVDITERRRAQDGRFGGRDGARTVDFRVATTPSVNGEKLVIRILDRNVGLRSLNDLGMPEHMLKDFTRATHSRAGMILATGPTGSGKTSTLYAALSQLDAVQLNLVTIEDPVEYELNGATQIPVNPKAGVTFESGLKSILRQDPDVIFVGEMRDLDAAQIALRSALTGHLVFSSLHTRDAVGTISRLLDMGLDRPLLSSAVSAVLAQRLVRVLCRNCRRQVSCEGNELAELGFELPEGATIYAPAGCRKCEGTGYAGRTGVFELLVLDDELRAALNGGLSEDPFTKLARDKGFRSYREDAAQKVLLGTTSVEEVLKVT